MALKKAGLFRILCELIWFLGGSLPLRNNQTRGWYGEWLARRYLKRKNLSVLKKNWRSPQDARREIDLVCLDGECLVFVEVRARSESSLNSGYYSINNQKKNTLLRGCLDFLNQNKDRYNTYRFDVVEIDLAESHNKLFHHENVSLFP
jgi:putative endonuclease